jgi:enoyl-CoA hydratase/carnithine racemase
VGQTGPFSAIRFEQKNVAKDPAVKAAVLISGKSDNFIAGADIRFIDTVSDFSSLKDGA